MKGLMIVAAAVAALSVTPALADNGKGKGHKDKGYNGAAHKPHPHGMPPGQAKKLWTRGQYIPATYYNDNDYWIDYRRYDLNAPPPGYRWVLVEDRGYLVNRQNGLVASVVANLVGELLR